MMLKDFTKWNARVSLVYAIGIWTLFGTYGYYHMNDWPRKKKQQQNDTDVSTDRGLNDLAEEPSAEQETKKSKDSFFKSTVVYRENFVPYSTRIINFVKSFASSEENGSNSQTTEK